MNWKWGTAFGIMVLITLISIVYAFVQTTKAQAAEHEAIAQKELADQVRVEAENQKVEAGRQRSIAENSMINYLKASKELEELKKKCK